MTICRLQGCDLVWPGTSFPGFLRNVEAASSAQMLVTIYQTIRHRIPEDCNLQSVGVCRRSSGVESELHSEYYSTLNNLDRCHALILWC
jgi:hypothetical protein